MSSMQHIYTKLQLQLQFQQLQTWSVTDLVNTIDKFTRYDYDKTVRSFNTLNDGKWLNAMNLPSMKTSGNT